MKVQGRNHVVRELLRRSREKERSSHMQNEPKITKAQLEAAFDSELEAEIRAANQSAAFAPFYADSAEFPSESFDSLPQKEYPHAHALSYTEKVNWAEIGWFLLTLGILISILVWAAYTQH